jgi:hypothetical protein
MGRLDELDLTLKLTALAEEERLTKANLRLLALRLHPGGGPAAHPGVAVRGADARREAPSLPGWPCWTGRGTGACWSSGWEGFASVEQWSRAYDEIVEFERMLAREGMILIKFWMHISPEEQLKRCKRRARDPLKQWELTEEDWRNREQRTAYERAVEDMVDRTDHELGRWTLVEGDSKRYARVKVVETTVAEIERGMRERGFEPPPA